MKKKIALLALCLLLAGSAIAVIYAFTNNVSANASAEEPRIARFADDFENGLFMFDSSRHDVLEQDWSAS